MLLIKVKRKDLLRDGKNISDSIAYLQEYVYDLLNIPKRISALIGQLQARAKLSVFDYENKERRESNNHTKGLNWPSFREALYRHPNMSQQP